MKKKQVIIAAAVLVVAIGAYFVYSALFSGGAAGNYPERNISTIVFSSAGGGTDLWNRMIGAEMEKELGVKIVVSNMPDGNGGMAVANVWSAAHDGYTWIGVSETITTHPATGSSERLAKDWQFYVMAGSKGIICVPEDSPYQTFADLVQAAKDGESVSIANSGLGKLWHLKAYVGTGGDATPIEHVPYQGSKPAIVACLSKEVSAVSASTGEVVEFVKSGQLRPLAMTENESFDYPGYGTVEPVTTVCPEAAQYYPLNQWLGFALPADTDPAILSKIEEAFLRAMQSQEILDFAETQVATIYNLTGEEANEMARRQESSMSWILQDLGLATVDPATLGIERP